MCSITSAEKMPTMKALARSGSIRVLIRSFELIPETMWLARYDPTVCIA